MFKHVMAWTAWVRALPLLAMGLGVTPQVHAMGEGMRCGSELVSEGDSMYEVRSTCGEPAATFSQVEYRTLNVYVPGCFQQPGPRTVCGGYQQQTVAVQVDVWTYDFGPSSFIRFVTFEQGKLHHVLLGDRGKQRKPTASATAPAAPAPRPAAE